MITFLRKGAPSLFKNLVPLYSNSWKVRFFSNLNGFLFLNGFVDLFQVSVVEKLLLDFVHRIEENGYNKGSLDGIFIFVT